MRIIAGDFKSRRLVAPEGDQTRPTPDRLREALFSALGHRVVDTVFLDAYAGSGSVGIEALSRGAKRAIFVEKHPKALAALRANLASLGLSDRATVIATAVSRALPTPTRRHRLPRPALRPRIRIHPRHGSNQRRQITPGATLHPVEFARSLRRIVPRSRDAPRRQCHLVL